MVNMYDTRHQNLPRALGVEHDEVVLPEPPEKLAALLIADRFARACRISATERSPSIAVKEPLLSSVDEERKIRIGVARIDEHGGDAARRAILDGQRPGKPDGHETRARRRRRM